MDKLLEYLPAILQVIGGLVLVATAITQLTPRPDDEEKVATMAKLFFRLLQWLPTLGINPRTKEIEDAYKEMIKK